jgi:predicted AlkP superfamily phosphohydrolase/phosphomutase
MKSYLMSIGMEVWTLFEKGYDVPKAMPIEEEDKKQNWEHEKSLNTLQVGISKKTLTKVLNCNNEKQLWDKLETIYAGDTKVKSAKLQTLKVQYEGLKMKYEENIFEYFERVDNIINSIRGLGVEVSGNELVEKILRTLPIL